MNKYEQLIEYIINDDEAKAKALFHDIVVAKSREIYESLMDEEEQEQGMGGNPVEDLANEVSADEEGMHEEDEEMDDMGDDEFGTDDDMGGDMDDMGDDDMGGEEDLEDRVMDLEAALDELKAEFDAMMGGEEGEGHHDDMMGGDDMGDMGDDMMGAPEDEGMYMEDDAMSGSGSASGSGSGAPSGKMEGKNPFAKSGSGSGKSGSGSGSGSGKKTAAESLREYVDKVSDGHGAEKAGAGEGEIVGKDQSSKPTVNKQSIVAGKNDMGGSSANIVRGGSEQAPDGTTPKGKAGGFVKPAQEIDVAKRNVNKPGGNKGAQDWYNGKAKAKSTEGSTTDGSLSVSKDSLIGGKIR